MIVATKLYADTGAKNNIIHGWKKIYGKGYNRCELIDDPDRSRKRQKEAFGPDPPASNWKKGSLYLKKMNLNKKNTKSFDSHGNR